MTKRIDLQPFLDYFRMLEALQQQGFLQMEVKKHECYITQPALHAMCPGDDPAQQVADGIILYAARRLRTYATFLSTEKGYADDNFAVHVVQPVEPHDLIYTILLTRHRSMLRTKEKIETITYSQK